MATRRRCDLSAEENRLINDCIQNRPEVQKLIDDHYGEGVGCYDLGWSDSVIATWFSLPVAVIAWMRESIYGPIGTRHEQGRPLSAGR
ncbi:MAG: hypothetical protein WA459_24800 [Stellaceae bacterium]